MKELAIFRMTVIASEIANTHHAELSASRRSARQRPSLAHLSSFDLAHSNSAALLADEPSASLPLNALPTLPELPAQGAANAAASPRNGQQSSADATSGASPRGASGATAASPRSSDSAAAKQTPALTPQESTSSFMPPTALPSTANSWILNDDERRQMSELGLAELGTTPGASPRGSGAATLPQRKRASGALAQRRATLTGDPAHPAFGGPELLQVWHGLAGAPSVLCVCPVLVPTGPVAVARRRRCDGGARGSASGGASPVKGAAMPPTEDAEIVPGWTVRDGEDAAVAAAAGTQDVVALHAVGTKEGSVDVVAVAQGPRGGLGMHVVHSFKARALADLPLAVQLWRDSARYVLPTACHARAILDLQDSVCNTWALPARTLPSSLHLAARKSALLRQWL